MDCLADNDLGNLPAEIDSIDYSAMVYRVGYQLYSRRPLHHQFLPYFEPKVGGVF